MKILEENKSPLDIFCEASKILNDAVEHTLGPYGTNTAIQNSKGQYDIINDGKSIIENLTSLDVEIAPALETLKQSSFETNRKAGDGTTSTIILMNALLQGAKEELDTHKTTPIQLKNRLNIIKDALLEELEKYKSDINEEDYVNVAKVALGGTKYSEEIADVFKFLGKGKRPTLIKSDIPNIEIEKIEGVNLTKIDLVSSLFTGTTEHTDIDIICVFEPLNRFNEITNLLRKVQQTGKTTFMFYNQVSADILENILFNYTNGAIKLIPIGLGGYGKGTYSIMEELSNYCDCNIVDNNECKISDISKIKFGHIDYATLNINQIILKSSKKIEKSYVHLDENSVIIRLGGTNIIEREEEYKRIEDAINSLGNAIEYGIVPGAGLTYDYLYSHVYNLGFEIPIFIKQAMSLIKNKLQITNEYAEKNNIYDSAMVTKEVISNSFSIVSQVITTNKVIHENIR